MGLCLDAKICCGVDGIDLCAILLFVAWVCADWLHVDTVIMMRISIFICKLLLSGCALVDLAVCVVFDVLGC